MSQVKKAMKGVLKGNSRTADKFVLWMPVELRDKVSERATANGRSMNAEFIMLIQAAIASGNTGGTQIRTIPSVGDPVRVEGLPGVVTELIPTPTGLKIRAKTCEGEDIYSLWEIV
ncbi:partition protein ATPase [Pseudomonas phage EL]|uniref:Arc-like DNA binding domain-containing protein n=1 Tax=Pseudomonas phage EL TaxID=273133 RepID=Q2Z0R8_9CAUD|nr:Arc family DNA-binding protein [Pseudomonas aeruginosa]YP_418196.1 partition protein ATPase [Pseudomonas phage EL]UZV40093.1 transcriptional regulator [Pseudomonas phage IR-QUMS-PaBa1-GHS-2021]CAG27257.1 hypothetical protein [Pseudomonas phage EL]